MQALWKVAALVVVAIVLIALPQVVARSFAIDNSSAFFCSPSSASPGT